MELIMFHKKLDFWFFSTYICNNNFKSCFIMSRIRQIWKTLGYITTDVVRFVMKYPINTISLNICSCLFAGLNQFKSHTAVTGEILNFAPDIRHGIWFLYKNNLACTSLRNKQCAAVCGDDNKKGARQKTAIKFESKNRFLLSGTSQAKTRSL